jgi:hypothetical protein
LGWPDGNILGRNMPLQHSASPQAFKANVKALMNERGVSPHVKDKSQALAIAYATKRRAAHKRGGKVKGYDTGGATDPVTAVISALQSGSNQVASPGSNPGMNASAPSPASFAAVAPAGVTSPTPTPTQNPAGFNSTPTNTGLGTSNPLAQAAPAANNNSFLAPQTVTAGLALQNNMQPVNPAGMAFGGMAQMPWFAKAEARNLTHTGPVMSAVPGRTDRHNVNVPSSSYVFPADFVSHLGQNNSGAGMKVLSNMGFGSGGPPMGARMPHGMGAPKPPRPMGISGDAGGRKGEGKIGTPTPVVIAGGEFVAPPEAIMKVLKTTDMKHAHKTLDAWVMKVRKDHIKTLRGLPPPAKS